MSPTIFVEKGYRFFFFSREELRLHVQSVRGEVKFWIEPWIELAGNTGLSGREIRIIEAIIREREREIRCAWRRHFSR